MVLAVSSSSLLLKDWTYPHFSSSMFFPFLSSTTPSSKKEKKNILKATSVSSSIFRVFFSPILSSLYRCSHYRHKRLCRYVIMLLCHYVAGVNKALVFSAAFEYLASMAILSNGNFSQRFVAGKLFKYF